jgi:hypothetical protein
MYAIPERDWSKLVADEWRHIRATVRQEHITPGNVPQSFHLLPFFRAHALYSKSPVRRQSANWARADILQPYFSDEE